MAKIEKRAVKMSDPSYRARAAEKRKTNLDLRARLTERRASERIEGYSRANKQEKYTRDLDILDMVDEDMRGEVGYKLLGNRKLRIDNKGQLTRERGIILKTRKVIERSADTEASILRRYEKDSWRTKKTEEYDKDGQLRSKSVVRKDGRYKENWVRDERGTLIRTSYFNNRWKDRRLFRPISEELSSADLNGRRILTRRQFASEKVFERDQDGNLELISRKGPLSFRYTRTSADRKTSKTYVSYLGGLFSNSYQSRLDQNGDLLSKDILCRRTLWSKSSAEYDDKGRIMKATSTVWKLYGSESLYLGGEVKKVTKNVLGVKFSTKIKMMSDRELDAQKLRAEEAATHSAAWEPKPLVHCSSAPDDGRQSEPNARNNLDRVMEAIAGQRGSVLANGTSPRHIKGTNALHEAMQRRDETKGRAPDVNQKGVPQDTPDGRQSELNARNNLDRVVEAIAGQRGSVLANGTSPRHIKGTNAIHEAMQRRDETKGRAPDVNQKGVPQDTPDGRQSEPNARNNLDRVVEAIAGQRGSVLANGTSPRHIKGTNALHEAMQRRDETKGKDPPKVKPPEYSSSEARHQLLHDQTKAASTRGFETRLAGYAR